MNKNIQEIQLRLMNSLARLDSANDNISEEVARSNAISQIANTYIKSCNLIIRVEECEHKVKSKLKDVVNNEE